MITEASPSMTGVLLVNLGTPDSPHPKDVRRYLIEFLTDHRVIDLPCLQRQLLVRGVIVPRRYKVSAKSYKAIWTSEGSPLLVYGNRVKKALQKELGDQYCVELAMRYRYPSIQEGLQNLLKKNLSHLIILPLFPQYASATTSSVHESLMNELKRLQVIPKVTFMNHFYDHPGFIKAFCSLAQKYDLNAYDQILFSFHGLPKRQLVKANCSGFCLSREECCRQIVGNNQNCYAAQCYATAYAIATELNLEENHFKVCFQSRLGKEPWIEPSTSATITQCAQTGMKNLLLFSPSFVCDCLETLYEIGVEYAQEFKQAGGESLTLVEGLNDHPIWIEALKEIIIQ